MKVVKYWSYLGFDVVIQAKFVRNGKDIEMFGREKVDVIRFKMTLYNPHKRKTDEYDGYEAHEHKQGTKEKWWHRWSYETINIGHAYEEEMTEMVKDVTQHINSRVLERDITDGLPGSLEGL